MEIFRGRRLWIEKSNGTVPERRRSGESDRTPRKCGRNPAGHTNRVQAPAPGPGTRSASTSYEAPAGTMEEGEDPQETAHRELIEEAGVSAGTMIPRGFIYTTPGYTDEKIWLFEARDLSPSDEFEKDADEVIEVMDVTRDKTDAMVADGTICDAKTICLIHRCRRGISVRTFLIAAGLACLLVLAIVPVCTSSSAPSYSVDSNGILSVTCAPVTTSETVLFTNETYTESQIILHTQTGDVTTYLSTRKTQKPCCWTCREPGRRSRGMQKGWSRTRQMGMRSCSSITVAGAGRRPGTRSTPIRITRCSRTRNGLSIT